MALVKHNLYKCKRRFYFLLFLLFSLSQNIFAQSSSSQNYRAIGPASFEKVLNSALEFRKVENYHAWDSLLKKALLIADSADYTYGKAYCLMNLGANGFSMLKPYDEMTTQMLKALRLFEELGDSAHIAQCDMNLGLVNYTLNNYEQAADLFNQCITYCDPNDNLSYTSKYLLGICYSELGYYMEAENLLRRSLKEFAANDWKKEMVVRGFLAKLLYNKGDIQASADSLESIIKEYEQFGSDNESICPLHSFISTSYLSLGNIDKTIKHAEFVRDNINISTGVIYYLEAMNNLHKAYAEKGLMHKAYESFTEWAMISDSIYNRQIVQRASSTKAAYDHEREMVKEKAKQELRSAIAARELQKQKEQRNAVIIGFVILLAFFVVIFNQRMKISRERALADNLLLNILPEDVAKDLKKYGSSEAKSFSEATVLFTDFKQFTEHSSNLTPSELVALINACFKEFDQICDKYGIEKIKTIGDSYMAAAGLSHNSVKPAHRTVLAALEMNDFIIQGNEDRTKKNKIPFEMRLGIHSGPVVAGIVGVKKFQYDIWGDTVNTASRMESGGEVGRVNISKTTYEMVKDEEGLSFEYRGKVQAKGKGEIDMYFVQRQT